MEHDVNGRQHRSFIITGEAMLELIKEKFDIPRDTKLVKLLIDPPTLDLIDLTNNARFLVESEVFSPVAEGALTPRLSHVEKYQYNTGRISLIEWKDSK